MKTPKCGNTVTGKILFMGDDKLYTGIVVEEDAGISRDAVIVELPNGDECTMLVQTLTEVVECEHCYDEGILEPEWGDPVLDQPHPCPHCQGE